MNVNTRGSSLSTGTRLKYRTIREKGKPARKLDVPEGDDEIGSDPYSLRPGRQSRDCNCRKPGPMRHNATRKSFLEQTSNSHTT